MLYLYMCMYGMACYSCFDSSDCYVNCFISAFLISFFTVLLMSFCRLKLQISVVNKDILQDSTAFLLYLLIVVQLAGFIYEFLRVHDVELINVCRYFIVTLKSQYK